MTLKDSEPALIGPIGRYLYSTNIMRESGIPGVGTEGKY